MYHHPTHGVPRFKLKDKHELLGVKNISVYQDLLLSIVGKEVKFYSTIDKQIMVQVPFGSRLTRIRNKDRLISVSGTELHILDMDELIYAFPFAFSDHHLIEQTIYGIESSIKLCDLRIGICTHVIAHRTNAIAVQNFTLASVGDSETKIYDLRMIGREAKPFQVLDIGGFDCSLESDSTYLYIQKNRGNTIRVDLLGQALLSVPGLPSTSDYNYCMEGKKIVAYDNYWQEKYDLKGHLDKIRQIFVGSDLYSVANDGIILWERSFETQIFGNEPEDW